MGRGSGEARGGVGRIQGQIQGGSFRAWTLASARSLRLEGWVRNRLDGSVELRDSGLSCATRWIQLSDSSTMTL
ncbi:MAG: acylphosphatase [Alphaproteobacteria bacterium]|nr:acylphosphatase [Alphaproteobacteria bacterium]